LNSSRICRKCKRKHRQYKLWVWTRLPNSYDHSDGPLDESNVYWSNSQTYLDWFEKNPVPAKFYYCLCGFKVSYIGCFSFCFSLLKIVALCPILCLVHSSFIPQEGNSLLRLLSNFYYYAVLKPCCYPKGNLTRLQVYPLTRDLTIFPTL
jgi:hypothetical protein